ncbi:MAG: anti-sigma factor family protein [Gemmatimonadota bacterium]
MGETGQGTAHEPAQRGGELKEHLNPDQIERCATGEPGTELPAALGAHLRLCSACRGEVAALETLHTHLRKLPHLDPSPAFTRRVIARVTLPVPWHQRAWSAVRRRWVAIGAGLATATGSVGGMAYWLFGQQELTPSELSGFLFSGLQDLGLRITMAGGRVLYDLGILELLRSLAENVAPSEAAGGMALLSLIGAGSLWAMKRLMEPHTPRLSRAVER